ncbi:MAG: DegT/DnrJ/EryC1/StrS aminotransferase family protein [Salibacteraceae bacterium]|jgi:dTDP-4-amino-4,6-dideoxygalactose transaminase|nr:DegT/DnrJ/EryC1/StrS aminotransferase family protein [Salibacteraceae bacterium]
MIPFSPPRIDQKIIDEVTLALTSGWITTGPKTKLFERKLEAYTNARRVFCCNANANGLELFMRWLGVGPGDEVIIPAYTYCATANIVIHLGATPVMVDVREDFTIDPEKVEAAITAKTKAIVPVDLGGLPADYPALWAIVNRNKTQFSPTSEAQKALGRIALVTDAAHSVGAMINGEKLGNQADAMVFSFHAVKNLTTAEGGAVCLNLPKTIDCDEVYTWLNTRSLHGQSKDALAKTQAGGWEYDVVEAGWKCNMTDLQAAIGLVELERYDADTMIKRQVVAEAYQNAFSQQKWALCPVLTDKVRTTSYHLYLLRIRGIDRPKRDAIIQSIFDGGVSVNVHYKPLPLMTAYKSRGYKMDDYPVSKMLWESEISLPIFYDITEEQIQKVISVVTSAVVSHL